MSFGRRLVKRVVMEISRPTFGRVRMQPFFLWLHGVSLSGLNIGASADYPASSGESVVIRRLPPQPVVLDVGANIGDYSALVLRIRPRADIWAFEPSSMAFRQLEGRLGDRVRARPYGLGADHATVSMFGPSAGSPLSSTYARHHEGLSFAFVESVELRRLDDVWAEESGPTIDLLKLDVEGHELAAIRGAQELIARGAVRAIQFEFGGSNIDSRTFLRDFFELLDERYEIHRVVRDGLAPVRYSDTTEIFTTTNYVALLRR